MQVAISGTGLFTPGEAISNAELVESFNRWADAYNLEHQPEIDAGEIEPAGYSDVGFIEKASGIKSRFVVEKSGILDSDRMRPRLRRRSDEEQSLQCEMAVVAATQALEQAGKSVDKIGCVIAACSNFPRPYPALAIEIQHALGIEGFAYDMNVACSAATFGIQAAANAVSQQQAGAVLVVNPEICSGHLDFRDRDSHFIFGDACTALVIEQASTATSPHAFALRSAKLKTTFSNNIRNNSGFLNRSETGAKQTNLFRQQGRKVFKEVVPLVAGMISGQLKESGLCSADIKRFWLHQANLNMNQLIARKVMGSDYREDQAPVILDRYANTSSAGSIIAYHCFKDDFSEGDLGVLCSFGAGYSVGSLILRKM